MKSYERWFLEKSRISRIFFLKPCDSFFRQKKPLIFSLNLMFSLCLFINLFTEVYENFFFCLQKLLCASSWQRKKCVCGEKLLENRFFRQTRISVLSERWSGACGQLCLMGKWILLCTFERTCVYNKHALFFFNNICDEVLCNSLLSGWWLMPGLKALSTKIWGLLFSRSLELWPENSCLVNKIYSLSVFNCLLHVEATSLVIHVCNAPPQKSGPLNAVPCKYSNAGSFRLFHPLSFSSLTISLQKDIKIPFLMKKQML